MTTTRNQGTGENRTAATEKRQRKPYQKPAFRHERVFETTALVCGKQGGTSHQCNHNPKHS
jgi:hypothetical protein